MNLIDIILLPTIGLLILFTDSVGPWLAVKDKVWSLFTGQMPYKQKTER